MFAEPSYYEAFASILRHFKLQFVETKGLWRAKTEQEGSHPEQTTPAQNSDILVLPEKYSSTC